MRHLKLKSGCGRIAACNSIWFASFQSEKAPPRIEPLKRGFSVAYIYGVGYNDCIMKNPFKRTKSEPVIEYNFAGRQVSVIELISITPKPRRVCVDCKYYDEHPRRSDLSMCTFSNRVIFCNVERLYAASAIYRNGCGIEGKLFTPKNTPPAERFADYEIGQWQ